MARPRFTDAAKEDLIDAWLHIAVDNTAAADRVVDRIDDAAQRLSDQPLMGRARPELGQGVRSMPTNTPYVLFYRAEPSCIVVLRVLHHARDVDSTPI